MACIWYFGFLPGPLSGRFLETAVSTAIIPEMSRRLETNSAPGGLQWQKSLQMLQSLQALGFNEGIWMIVTPYFEIMCFLLRSCNCLSQVHFRKNSPFCCSLRSTNQVFFHCKPILAISKFQITLSFPISIILSVFRVGVWQVKMCDCKQMCGNLEHDRI